MTQLHITVTLDPTAPREAAEKAIRERLEASFPWIEGVDLDGVTEA